MLEIIIFNDAHYQFKILRPFQIEIIHEVYSYM